MTLTAGSETNPSRQCPPLVTTSRRPALTASCTAATTSSVEAAAGIVFGPADRVEHVESEGVHAVELAFPPPSHRQQVRAGSEHGRLPLHHARHLEQ